MNRRGMTLLELMVVVGIISIFAGLSVVTFQGMIGRTKGSGAIRQLYAEALTARQVARTSGSPVRFWSYPGGDGLTHVRWARLGCDSSGTYLNPICPSTTCANTTSCDGGCACMDQGNDIPIPTTLALPANFVGLCFVGGTGVPRGPSCDPTTAPLTAFTFTSTTNNSSKVYLAPQNLMVDPLTGLSRLCDTLGDGGC